MARVRCGGGAPGGNEVRCATRLRSNPNRVPTDTTGAEGPGTPAASQPGAEPQDYHPDLDLEQAFPGSFTAPPTDQPQPPAQQQPTGYEAPSARAYDSASSLPPRQPSITAPSGASPQASSFQGVAPSNSNSPPPHASSTHGGADQGGPSLPPLPFHPLSEFLPPPPTTQAPGTGPQAIAKAQWSVYRELTTPTGASGQLAVPTHLRMPPDTDFAAYTPPPSSMSGPSDALPPLSASSAGSGRGASVNRWLEGAAAAHTGRNQFGERVFPPDPVPPDRYLYYKETCKKQERVIQELERQVDSHRRQVARKEVSDSEHGEEVRRLKAQLAAQETRISQLESTLVQALTSHSASQQEYVSRIQQGLHAAKLSIANLAPVHQEANPSLGGLLPALLPGQIGLSSLAGPAPQSLANMSATTRPAYPAISPTQNHGP
eukprot:gene10218-1846_t